MEGEGRRRLCRNRKPLCDRTNTISQSQSSQSSSATVIASKTKPKPILEPKPSAAGSGSGNYASYLPTSLLALRHSSLPGDENCDVFEIGTALNHRQTVLQRKVKEKAVIAPLVVYSARRLVNVGGDRNEHKDMSLLEPCIIPRKKKQRCTKPKPKQDASLQVYIQQQKAYFKEVDAFELSEEEVASGNELD